MEADAAAARLTECSEGVLPLWHEGARGVMAEPNRATRDDLRAELAEIRVGPISGPRSICVYSPWLIEAVQTRFRVCYGLYSTHVVIEYNGVTRQKRFRSSATSQELPDKLFLKSRSTLD